MPLHEIDYRDPLGHMEWMADSKRLRASVRWDGDGWSDRMREVGEALDPVTIGNVFVMLGREDAEHFTDSHIEIVVRYDNDEDTPKIEEVLRNFQ